MESCPNLLFSGLMTIGMPDYTSTPENFKTLLNCRAEICKALDITKSECELSMGMSGDFEQAIKVRHPNSVRDCVRVTMAKKSSKKGKGNSPASKSASSTSSAFSPPLHGGAGTSVPAVSASPIPSAGASTSSSLTTMAETVSPASLVPTRTAAEEARMRLIEQQILDLRVDDLRVNALAELSKNKEVFHDLAPLLWFSFGTVVILLQEVISIYPMLPSSASLTQDKSNSVCNAITLLQCIASHPEIRTYFARAQIPIYLYQFLTTKDESRPFEQLRISSLGVIGALVKVPDTTVVISLLSSEIMPFCLHTMDNGTELSRTVETFVLRRLLQDDVGLSYICYLPERLFALCQALGNVVSSLAKNPSVRLLKQVIRCYLRLLDDQRSLWALRNTFPRSLSDGTFVHFLSEHQTARIWLQELLDGVTQKTGGTDDME